VAPSDQKAGWAY
jgi:hypothetical protein